MLEASARNKLNPKKVVTQWPDMLRVAGSLVTNQVRAYDLLRMFARQGSPTPLGQAFAEYGRIDKTMHLLSMLDPMDSSYRRSLGKQLSVQESRHRLARKICHGNSGRIRQAYREGQEDQLAALGLVVNAVVLWNSRYLSAIVDQLRAQGVPVKDEDVARLSPLGHAHLNCLGRYAIASSAPDKGLRPLARRRCPRSVPPVPLSWTMTVSEPLTDDRLNDGSAHGLELFHLRVSQKRQWCSVEPSPLLRAEERERTRFALLLVRGFHRGRLGSLGLPVAAKRVQ